MLNYIKLLALLVLTVSQGSAQQCSFKYDNGTELSKEVLDYGLYMDAIKDTESPGKILITLIGQHVSGINNITTDSISGLLYMNATLQGASIVLTLTEDFIDFEKHEARLRIYIVVNFQCTTGTSQLEIYQLIDDTNNHFPEFINTPYTYTLPMPFPNNFRIDLLGDISARDYDISNKNMTFFLKPEDPMYESLSASWLSVDSLDIKRYHASLMTKMSINWRNDVQFDLFATDSGDPPNTSNTTVTIIVDKNNSISRFSEPIYIADYRNLRPEEANGLVLEFQEGDVSLSGGIVNITSVNVIDMFSNYSDNFHVNPSTDNTRITIKLVDPPESFFNQSFVVLMLKVSKGGSEDRTVIQVLLPGGETIPDTCRIQDNEECTDNKPVIITLAVLLAAMTVGLIVSIVLNRRRGEQTEEVAETNNAVPENRGEMKELHRMESDASTNGAPRRSVAFNDTVEEIKVARL